jgi:hypothetical protein
MAAVLNRLFLPISCKDWSPRFGSAEGVARCSPRKSQASSDVYGAPADLVRPVFEVAHTTGRRQSARLSRDKNRLLPHGLPSIPANSERRRALQLLARSPMGCTETLVLAHGFSAERLRRLLLDGLAIAQPSTMLAGQRQAAVRWMIISVSRVGNLRTLPVLPRPQSSEVQLDQVKGSRW